MTDDWDRRCLMNILADYYMADVLNEGHSYCDSNTLHQISTATDHHVRNDTHSCDVFQSTVNR